MSSNVKAKLGVSGVAFGIVIAIHLFLQREIGDLNPTAKGIFSLEVCVLSLIFVGFAAEEIAHLLSKEQRGFRDRFLMLVYLLSAFSSSVIIFEYLVRFMKMPGGSLFL